MEGKSRIASAGCAPAQAAWFNLVSHSYMGRRDKVVLDALRIFYPGQADLIMSRLKSGEPVRLGVFSRLDMRLRMNALHAQGFKVTMAC